MIKHPKKYKRIKIEKADKIKNNDNIFEIGLAFLRVILSFNVVVCHCCKKRY